MAAPIGQPPSLEERVSRLERLSVDQLSSPLVVVNPDGTITAQFTGHVQAQGLDLLEGTSASPPKDRRVRWLDTTFTGVEREAIFGFTTAAGIHDLYLIADAASSASVDVRGGPVGQALVTGVVGPNFYTIMNDASPPQSSFVTAPLNAPLLALSLDTGGAIIPINGLTGATVTISHRLGRVPAAVVATPTNRPGGDMLLETESYSSTQAVIRANMSGGINATANGTVVWIAAG